MPCAWGYWIARFLYFHKYNDTFQLQTETNIITAMAQDNKTTDVYIQVTRRKTMVVAVILVNSQVMQS